ncbi:sentrin-specific protease 6 isoform X2 [Halyomorpha halys]|uniref:sentrin-specific protease 6 isoform X2 n=1 Tax=Halyomorpha halys TaxID=286706 RepID=UPI0006D4EF73|nr:sentrin-specific protease 6-like isoform X2 [Halyomorpha halys]
MEKLFRIILNGRPTLLTEQQLNIISQYCGYSCYDLSDVNFDYIPAETISNSNGEDGLMLRGEQYCGYETVYIQGVGGVCEQAIVITNNVIPVKLHPGGPVVNTTNITQLHFNTPLSFTNRNIILSSGGINAMNENVNKGGEPSILSIVTEDGSETLVPRENGMDISENHQIQIIQVEPQSVITVPPDETTRTTHLMLYNVRGEQKKTLTFPKPLVQLNSTIVSQNVSKMREVCLFCGFPTPDPGMCQRCRRSLPARDNSSNKSDNEKDVRTSPEKSDCRKRKCLKKSKKSEEMVCVTISSDEEDDTDKSNKSISNGVTFQEPTTSVFDKEPVITADVESNDCNFPDSLRGGGIEIESLLDNPELEKAQLNCRTVRFGTYKVAPEDKILVTEHGLKIKVPSLSKTNCSTVIKILMKDIVKVLIHFGNKSSSGPTMFYYITHEASKKIREALHMSSKNKNHYFDPTSKEELHKRITLLPDKITEEERLFIKSIYESRCLMEEITWDEANDILVRAAPKDIQQDLKKEKHSSMKQIASTSQSSTSTGIQIIMVYPPPPAKGGISINTEDYACLKEDQFLNDVIIDFYLKYLWLNVLSEEDRKRTHIFSSFFYKRLTMCPPRQSGHQENQKLSPAEKRHARVKGWTKSVDIFEKDFIIIPINERSHWFLGIICFPGLTGPVRMSDNQAVPNVIRKKSDASVLAGGLTPAKIYGTTITVVPKEKISIPKAPTISLLEPDEERDGESDRDEAEADDDDMEPNTTDEESGKEEDLMDEATPRVNSKSKPQLEPIKQPCILVFDSLACTSRSRVCATLREYLLIEWKVRHRGKLRDFSKDVFKGAVPKVPQQTNYIDCGVYVLQYVEAFFKNPITDYRMPIRSIKEWFTMEEVNRKRYDIMQLLLSLMKEQNVDIPRLNLPFLNLTPYSHYDGDEEEVMEEGEFDEEGVEEGEEEPICEEEEEEDEEEHFNMEELFNKSKRFDPHGRLDQQQIRLEVKQRMEQSPRSEPPTPARIETTPSRIVEPGPAVQQLRVESVRSTPITSRVTEQVTICEASSKRKLPLSLKDIRSPRLLSGQTSIEKVKKMRVE